jgi:hypothetical protein
MVDTPSSVISRRGAFAFLKALPLLAEVAFILLVQAGAQDPARDAIAGSVIVSRLPIGLDWDTGGATRTWFGFVRKRRSWPCNLTPIARLRIFASRVSRY